MVNALVSVDGVEMVGELQLTTLEYLELKKVQHKFYTIERAFRSGEATPEEAHAAIVEQICDAGESTTGQDSTSLVFCYPPLSPTPCRPEQGGV